MVEEKNELAVRGEDDARKTRGHDGPDLTTDFECDSCGHGFSVEVKPGEETTCPECGSADVTTLEVGA